MRDMVYRFKGWRTLAAASLLVAGLGCGEPEILGQEAAFGSSFLRDESGKADYLLDFGVIAVGGTGVATVEVANRGRVPLVLHHGSSRPPFRADPVAPLTLEVGSTAQLRYLFSPEAERRFERVATLSSNEEGGRTYTIRLVGEGRQAALSCDPASLNFGVVAKGAERGLVASCINTLSFPIELEAPRLRGDSELFDASLAGGVEGRLQVPSGGTVAVEVRFRAQSLGAYAATLELSDVAGRKVAELPLRAEASAAMLEIEPEGCLDFSYVLLGESARRNFQLRSLGSETLQIDRIERSGGADFEILSQTPLEVAPEGARDLEVEFRPTRGGPQQASLAIHATDTQGMTTVQTACVQGFGGGPSLQCTPASIDYGMVAVGVPLVRRIFCLNVAEEAGADPLKIRGARSSSPFFFTRIVEEDGSEGPRKRGYKGGEGFVVEVSYAPSRERFDSGTIAVETTGGEVVETQVSGQGRELAPCDFSLRPPSLDFGLLEAGGERTLGFSVQNHGESECLIHSLHLAEGSDPAFHLEVMEDLVLEGEQTITIPIRFAPGAAKELHEGEVRFQISNAAAPDQRVPLRGAAGKACVVLEPEVVDFGAFPPVCGNQVRWVSALNTCNEDVTIGGVGVEPAGEGSPFQLVQRPVLPRRLRVRERVDVAVDFRPATGEGSHAGYLRFQVVGVGPVVAPLLGRTEQAPEQTDTFVQRGPPQVDVLWVIDNSSSLGGFHERLAANLPAFLKATVARQLDFHLAVTTSGVVKGGDDCPGGAWGGEDGRFFPIDGSHPRILRPSTPNLAEHWAFNMQVGSCHSYETYLEAAYRALSPPLINQVKDSRYPSSPYKDGNAGFLRPDAALSIIFVADEKDQSTEFNRTVNDYLSFFLSLKPHGRFRAHGITGSRSDEPSPCGLANADRLRRVIDETGGTWLDICTPLEDTAAWEAGLERMSDGAFGFVHGFVLRSFVADSNGDGRVNDEDILVEVDGVPQSALTELKQRRWNFHPATRSLEFSPFFAPRAGARIDVTYRVACALD